ncbi:hypothetical protein GDO86_018258, partial [Hymenochirus boettgeri]
LWRLEDALSASPAPSQRHSDSCSFVLKPTHGQFLGEYNGISDLHVGITSTKGVVYSYNQCGVDREAAGWEQSVNIRLGPTDQYELIHQWDRYLEDFTAAEQWAAQRYREEDHNCYTFALMFINAVLVLQNKKTFSKEEFTRRFVLPKTRRVSKYLTICKGISQGEFFILPS